LESGLFKGLRPKKVEKFFPVFPIRASVVIEQGFQTAFGLASPGRQAGRVDSANRNV
jgi:hypothetical protein